MTCLWQHTPNCTIMTKECTVKMLPKLPFTQIPCSLILTIITSLLLFLQSRSYASFPVHLKFCPLLQGLPRWLSGEESACQRKRRKRWGFIPWVGKIPWGRKWQPARVFLPGEVHRQRSLAGYSPWGHKELDVTEHLSYNGSRTFPAHNATKLFLGACDWSVPIFCFFLIQSWNVVLF